MFLLSLDELARIHETLIRPVRRLLNTSGLFYYAWIIPGLILVAAFLLVYVRFLANQPQRLRWGLIISGAVFVAGAIGFEALSATFADNRGISDTAAVLPSRTFWFLLIGAHRGVSGDGRNRDLQLHAARLDERIGSGVTGARSSRFRCSDVAPRAGCSRRRRCCRFAR